MRTAQANRIAWRLREYDRLLKERIAKGLTQEQAQQGLLDAVKKASQGLQKRRTKVRTGSW